MNQFTKILTKFANISSAASTPLTDPGLKKFPRETASDHLIRVNATSVQVSPSHLRLVDMGESTKKSRPGKHESI
jgi:hypothetical protein